MGDDEQQGKNKNDEKLLIKFLALQYERVGSHGNKIWEEMKHFSWALYLLLGAPFILKHWAVGDNWEVWYKIWLIIFPLLAIIVAIIAIVSIRKESKDFLDALGTVLSIEKRLRFHEENDEKTPKMLVSEKRKGMLKKDESIDDFIERMQPNICKPTSSNRSLFVSYFIGLFIIGIVEILYFVLYALRIL